MSASDRGLDMVVLKMARCFQVRDFNLVDPADSRESHTPHRNQICTRTAVLDQWGEISIQLDGAGMLMARCLAFGERVVRTSARFGWTKKAGSKTAKARPHKVSAEPGWIPAHLITVAFTRMVSIHHLLSNDFSH